MANLLALSTEIINTGHSEGPINRITHELSEINDRIAVVEAFSHSVLFRTDDGLVAFDTSGVASGNRVVEAIRFGPLVGYRFGARTSGPRSWHMRRCRIDSIGTT